MRRFWAALMVLLVGSCRGGSGEPASFRPEPIGSSAEITGLRVPPGFSIGVFAENVPGARSMAISSDGTVYVGTRRPGHVYAIRDADADGRADEVRRIASGLDSPNGVAWRDRSLYVAEISRVLRFDLLDDGRNFSPSIIIMDGLPSEAHHGWRYIGFGPDDRLYIGIGAPCNICETSDPFASIVSLAPDGADSRIFARGIRNTVGFAWHPETRELWFTDNGRDRLGDDLPPDELNHAPGEGLHFGYPYRHGIAVDDPEFGSRIPRDLRPVAPVRELGPHVAALGMRFYTGSKFPVEYRGHIFIAEHGSWDRSEKIGYRISFVRLDGNRAISYEPFVEGWLQSDGSVTGRPVDLLVMPDGALLVSDDHAGMIYRIDYRDG